ncbi:hypothetical protein ACLOJK_032584 [Asimina triloba]
MKVVFTEAAETLYQYIHGANENSSQLEMTSPILTSVNAAAAKYIVRLYLSPEIEDNAPRPLPDLNLQLDKWESRCIVVRKFSGFAEDDNTVEEAEHLLASLTRSNSNSTNNTLILEDEYPYAISQYDSSSHLEGRVNEVWMNVLGYGGECKLDDLVKEAKPANMMWVSRRTVENALNNIYIF